MESLIWVCWDGFPSPPVPYSVFFIVLSTQISLNVATDFIGNMITQAASWCSLCSFIPQRCYT